MKMQLKSPIVGLLFVISQSAVVYGSRGGQVTYSEILSLKANCTDRDSCQYSDTKLDDNLLSRNCECGPQCVEYNTCCVDSPNRFNTFWALRHDMPKCIAVEDDFSFSKGYWMVSKCNPRWRGSRSIISLCNQAAVHSNMDPFASIPAVDIETQKTYKNYFCGVCNGIDPSMLKLWNIQLGKRSDWKNEEHPSDDQDLADQMEYNEKVGSWGVWEQDHEGNFQFENVSMITIPPEGSARCVHGLISDCDPKYADLTVRRKCHAYMGLVYVNYLRYRNVHCAICNFVNISTQGEKMVYCVGVSGFGAGMPLSLTHLMDVNPRDGTEVGRVSKCKSGESYDPFFKKCRSLVCGVPGFSIVNGKCVKL